MTNITFDNQGAIRTQKIIWLCPVTTEQKFLEIRSHRQEVDGWDLCLRHILCLPLQRISTTNLLLLARCCCPHRQRCFFQPCISTQSFPLKITINMKVFHVKYIKYSAFSSWGVQGKLLFVLLQGWNANHYQLSVTFLPNSLMEMILHNSSYYELMKLPHSLAASKVITLGGERLHVLFPFRHCRWVSTPGPYNVHVLLDKVSQSPWV